MREELLSRIGDINNFELPRPLVSLELFFEGNDDYASIGYNLPEPPHPQDFYELLKTMRERDDVHDIIIEVKDLEDEDGWPSTDTIWFIVRGNDFDVLDAFPERMRPDEVVEGFENSTMSVEVYEIPDGCRALGAWYD